MRKEVEENRQICKNCKHFEKNNNLTYCDLVKTDLLEHGHNNIVVGIIVEILGYIEPNAFLRVNKNFGCVLFEGKERK